MIERIKQQLDAIKSLSGVENVVLTQRDGNPITSSGVWLSKNDIFNVSAATSAIYNVGLALHGQWLKYMVIEGSAAKIMIAPLHNGRAGLEISHISRDACAEYFVALTTLASVNLGGLFIKTQASMQSIMASLQGEGVSFKPPLRDFNEQQIKQIMEKFNAKDDSEDDLLISQFVFGLDFPTFKKCEDILWGFQRSMPDLIYSGISLKGGFIITSIQPSQNFNLTPDVETAMSFSLFDTATRYAWLLKKTTISSILLDCQHYLHFIYGFNGGIFSSYIFKNETKMGLMRLMLPKYLSLIQKILDDGHASGQALSPASCEVVNTLMIK